MPPSPAGLGLTGALILQDSAVSVKLRGKLTEEAGFISAGRGAEPLNESF